MYEFAKCLEFLEATGKELFEEKFIILKDDHEVIYKLLLYIIEIMKTLSNMGFR